MSKLNVLAVSLLLVGSTDLAAKSLFERCRDLMRPAATTPKSFPTVEVSEFRKKYIAIAHDPAALRAYAQTLVKKLNDGLSTREFVLLDHQDRDLAETAMVNLKQAADISVRDSAFNLDALNRIAYFYAQLLDSTVAPTTDSSFFANAYGRRSPREYQRLTEQKNQDAKGRERIVGLFGSDPATLSKAILGKTSWGRSYATTIYANGFYSSDRGWAFIPTTANLGFQSILWSISRGILFTGQAFETSHVDGSALPPAKFMEHDMNHSAVLAVEPYNPESAVFWDQLEKRIEDPSFSVAKKKLIYVSLFFMMHESNPNMKIECPHNVVSIHPMVLSQEVLARNLSKRLHSNDDLGQAYVDKPSESEVSWAVGTARRLIHEICPKP